jgi:hypothetical protein
MASERDLQIGGRSVKARQEPDRNAKMGDKGPCRGACDTSLPILRDATGRSIARRLGRTAKPRAAPDGLMISIRQSPSRLNAPRNSGPA